jgi:hypothetical protein
MSFGIRFFFLGAGAFSNLANLFIFFIHVET